MWANLFWQHIWNFHFYLSEDNIHHFGYLIGGIMYLFSFNYFYSITVNISFIEQSYSYLISLYFGKFFSPSTHFLTFQQTKYGKRKLSFVMVAFWVCYGRNLLTITYSDWLQSPCEYLLNVSNRRSYFRPLSHIIS